VTFKSVGNRETYLLFAELRSIVTAAVTVEASVKEMKK
jgi:hypothetical protein